MDSLYLYTAWMCPLSWQVGEKLYQKFYKYSEIRVLKTVKLLVWGKSPPPFFSILLYRPLMLIVVDFTILVQFDGPDYFKLLPHLWFSTIPPVVSTWRTNSKSTWRTNSKRGCSFTGIYMIYPISAFCWRSAVSVNILLYIEHIY